jgi:hypothetical protein
MSGARVPCPHDGCPGLELHNGKPDGCGHPTITTGCLGVVAERDALRLGFDALAAIVRDEYRHGGDALHEMAGTWGLVLGITAEQIDALRALEGTP